MFIIKPIQNKTEQENLCNRCLVTYDPDCMAYAAYIDDVFSGICQFRIRESYGYIRDLVPLPGVHDFEVMFIMGRAAMNFIDLCGVHVCKCRKEAGDGRLLRGIGFREDGGGELCADMTHMFDGSSCAGCDAKNRATVDEIEADFKNGEE